MQNITIPKNGYLYVYYSNESPVDVFFDNLQVLHTKGPLVEETHYYPFGLTMAGISSKAAGGLENKKKYNGIEFDNDLDINTYEAYYRNLDPQIGRWWQIDPKIENMEMWSPYASNYDNPIFFKDPLGDWPDWLDKAAKVASEVVASGAQGLLGALNAYTSDNVGGVLLTDGTNLTTSFQVGQKIGHVAAVVTGAIEDAVAGTAEVATVGGASPVAIPLAIHGTATITIALKRLLFAEHTNNARPSTKQTHQEGQTRKQQDREGSKGMVQPPRKRPPNHKGPWPPKPPLPKPPPPATPLATS